VAKKKTSRKKATKKTKTTKHAKPAKKSVKQSMTKAKAAKKRGVKKPRVKKATRTVAKKAVKRAARKTTARAVPPPPGLPIGVGAMAAAPRGTEAGVALAVGTCLTLAEADAIVQAAIPNGPHDIDSTLEDAGLISPNQRTTFREDVANRVRDHGCSINKDDVPNGATNTLRDVRTAVKANAGPQ
jgi:hypothetical protein